MNLKQRFAITTLIFALTRYHKLFLTKTQIFKPQSPKIQLCLEKFKAKGLLARVAGFKLIRRWAGFDRPHLRFKFKVLIIIDENVAHHGL